MLPQFNTIYQHVEDEVARLADITIETGAAVSPADDDYGPASLVDDNPAKVAKIEDTTGAWQLEFDSPQRADIIGLIHTTLDETTDSPGSPAPRVRIQGNNTASWATPAFEADISVPAWLGTGTRRWPVNPWLDLTAQDGYDEDGFLFWRLFIENQSQNIQVGELWLGQVIRRFDPDLRWDLRRRERKPEIENRTSFEVDTTYSRGTTIWEQEAELDADDEMAAALERHWYDVEGRARPWLIVPSGPIANDRCCLVKYMTTERQMEWNFENMHRMRLGFQEKGRGLRPGV
jgi:hypothetical protein